MNEQGRVLREALDLADDLVVDVFEQLMDAVDSHDFDRYWIVDQFRRKFNAKVRREIETYE